MSGKGSSESVSLREGETVEFKREWSDSACSFPAFVDQ